MTGIREDIELLVDAKRVLKFQIGNDHLAAAIDRIERKLRAVVDLMEKVNAFNLPRDEFLELHAQFILQESGINVGQLVIIGAPKPAAPPKPELKLVVSNDPPHTCKFCGSPSWKDPSEQDRPVDYCHPEDHGSPEVEA